GLALLGADGATEAVGIAGLAAAAPPGARGNALFPVALANAEVVLATEADTTVGGSTRLALLGADRRRLAHAVDATLARRAGVPALAAMDRAGEEIRAVICAVGGPCGALRGDADTGLAV